MQKKNSKIKSEPFSTAKINNETKTGLDMAVWLLEKQNFSKSWLNTLFDKRKVLFIKNK